MQIYKYFDGFINVVLAIFNFFSRIIFGLNPKVRKLLKRNVKIKELRKKDECYIIGNGPSLKNVDLSLLKDEETFTVNYFYKYRKDGFKSKFFVAVDDIFAGPETKKYLESVQSKDIVMFLRYNCYYNHKDVLDLNHCYFLYAKQFQEGNEVHIDCNKNMTACINVVLQCIQIALYMGYKKIYLLGCDFTEYAQVKAEHFYDVKLPRIYSMGDGARWAALAHYHHYALRKYADEHGMEIINLTPNSLIDAYKKDTIERIRQI